MKLILPSEFKLLQFDKINDVDINTSGGKRVIKIYRDDKLIAKSMKTKTRHKTGMRYFGIKKYKQYLPEEC
jgi:hypothetical protein